MDDGIKASTIDLWKLWRNTDEIGQRFKKS